MVRGIRGDKGEHEQCKGYEYVILQAKRENGRWVGVAEREEIGCREDLQKMDFVEAGDVGEGSKEENENGGAEVM